MRRALVDDSIVVLLVHDASLPLSLRATAEIVHDAAQVLDQRLLFSMGYRHELLVIGAAARGSPSSTSMPAARARHPQDRPRSITCRSHVRAIAPTCRASRRPASI